MFLKIKDVNFSPEYCLERNSLGKVIVLYLACVQWPSSIKQPIILDTHAQIVPILKYTFIKHRRITDAERCAHSKRPYLFTYNV